MRRKKRYTKKLTQAEEAREMGISLEGCVRRKLEVCITRMHPRRKYSLKSR